MAYEQPKVSVIVVNDEFSGQRLDNFLLRELKGVPRSLIYRIVRRGEVRVNDGRARVYARLKAGDRIRLPPLRTSDRARRKAATEADGAVYPVLYEDDQLLVIDKPAGTAVHAGSGVRAGIIENLRAARRELRFLDLVHRLDRETSGCLVLAKRRSALRALHEQLRHNVGNAGPFVKRYQLLVGGEWRAHRHVVEAALRKNVERSGERVVVVAEDGLPARTRFDTLCVYQSGTLVQAAPITGRTHQIRVHAAWSGHPVAGDEKYGDKRANSVFRTLGLHRLFLHASYVRFEHPLRRTPVEIQCALPPDLQRVLGKLADPAPGDATVPS